MTRYTFRFNNCLLCEGAVFRRFHSVISLSPTAAHRCCTLPHIVPRIQRMRRSGCTPAFVDGHRQGRGCRKLRVTTHVAQKQRRSGARPSAGTTRHEVHRLSHRARKRVEEVFGWVETVDGGRKLRYCGVAGNHLWVELTIAGYNLVRLAKLTTAAA